MPRGEWWSRVHHGANAPRSPGCPPRRHRAARSVRMHPANGQRQHRIFTGKPQSAQSIPQNKKPVVTFREPFAMLGVYALAVSLPSRPRVVDERVPTSWPAEVLVSMGTARNLLAGSAPTGSRRGAFCSPQLTLQLHPQGPLVRCSPAPCNPFSPLIGLAAAHCGPRASPSCRGTSCNAACWCQRSSSLPNCTPRSGLQSVFLVDLS